MYHAQITLNHHLGIKFKSPQLKSLQSYAGELSNQTVLETVELPGIFTMFIDSIPDPQIKIHQFDIIVVTESRTFDKLEKMNNNLQLSSDVFDYLTKYNHIQALGKRGTYFIDPNQVRATTILINDRFTVIAITIYMQDRRVRS